MAIEATGFATETFGDNKLSKRNEVSTSKTIAPTAPDNYENTIKSLGGQA